jgi:hypothetical protein
MSYDLLYTYVKADGSIRRELTENVSPRDADAIVRIFLRTRIADQDPTPITVELIRRTEETCGQWTIADGQIVYDPVVKT